jgi:signal transduction histidine kinase
LCATGVGVVGGIYGAFARPSPDLGPGYIFAKNVYYWASWAAVIPVVVFVIRLVRRRGWPAGRTLLAHASAALVLAAVHRLALALFDLVEAWLSGATPGFSIVARSLAFTDRLSIEWELTMYAAIAAFASASELETESRDRALRQAQLEGALARAKLALFESRLEPHFLFNSLHAVAALIRPDPEGAEDVVARLGRMLRATLETNEASEVRLAEDLSALDDYLAIERRQMRDRLRVTFAIEEDAREAAVPRFLVQPLVENAIRHGLQPRAAGGSVRVVARRVGDRLAMEVSDDGVGFGTPARHGTGLGLVGARERLAALFGEAHTFAVESIPGRGTRVAIEIPFRVAAT